MIEFTVPGPPVGKGRPRATTIGGHARMYTPAATVSYESLVAHVAHEAMAGRALLDGPLAMRLDIRCAVPASWSKRKRSDALAGRVRPTTKPDSTNIAKAVEDGCNGVAYRDDVQIVESWITKRYATTPGVVVTVEQLPALLAGDAPR